MRALIAIAVVVTCLWAERGRVLRRSTWDALVASQELSWCRPISLKTLHGYIYGRWTRQYIDMLFFRIAPRLGEKGKAYLANRYHGKVITDEQARAIIELDHDVSLQDLEQVVPYSMARDIVLDGPPDVAVYDCACRLARENPCRPIQVCMAIGQPFVDFILEHHPQTSRRIGKEEALRILEEEHERGHLHSAWFKDACLDRFYAICNCCKCCCGGITAMMEYGIPMMASSGYIARVDEEACRACGICERACPFQAVSVEEASLVDRAACMGCGVCVAACPYEARWLERDEGKGPPLDVRLLP
jgi:ferredoxin